MKFADQEFLRRQREKEALDKKKAELETVIKIQVPHLRVILSFVISLFLRRFLLLVHLFLLHSFVCVVLKVEQQNAARAGGAASDPRAFGLIPGMFAAGGREPRKRYFQHPIATPSTLQIIVWFSFAIDSDCFVVLCVCVD